MMEVYAVSQDEMDELKVGLKLVEDEVGCTSYENFHYFSYNTSNFNSLYVNPNQEPPIYFLAQQNNEIIGVLKLGHYAKSHIFWAVNYVDVHSGYRMRGVATALYRALNEWAKGKDIKIVGTRLSKLGKEAKLNELRKRILTDVENWDDEYEIPESSYTTVE